MRLVYLLMLCTASSNLFAQTFTVATLNTESGSDTQTFRVAEVMREVGRVEIWSLQEVASEQAAIEYTVAAGSVGNRQKYRYLLSDSGKNHEQHRQHDHLAVVYNSSEFREVEVTELHSIRSRANGKPLGKTDWHLRGALFVRFQHIDSGKQFYVGNVHLKCCAASDDAARHGPNIRAHQARLLKEWIDRRDVPVLLLGDFNVPVKPNAPLGNASSLAFGILSESMTWHRPTNPVKTYCGHLFDSMLDHVFAVDSPELRVNSVSIGKDDASYCEGDEQGYPDHRPVLADVTLSPK